MKKIVLSVAAVFAFGFANAQETQVVETSNFGFAKGDIIVEGAIQFGTTNNKNTEVKTSNFAFTPKAGLFLTDKAMVGVQLGIGSGKTETTNPNSEVKSNNLAIGVFGRYYFLELGERFKTYGELGLGYETAKGETSTPLGTVKDNDVNTLGVGLSLGMNYFMTPNMAVSFTLADVLSYGTSKVDAEGAKAQTEFNGNLNVFNNIFATPTIGLMYKF